MQRRIDKLAILCVVFGVLAVAASNVSASMIVLDKSTQNGGGNMGVSYRPFDEFGLAANFVMTARSQIDAGAPYDAYASGSVGTIMIDDGRGDKGAGVQNARGRGSKGISGRCRDSDEELIFWYDQAVTLDSLAIALRDIDFGRGTGHKDDPVIFLSVAGTGTYGVTIQESTILGAFTSTGHKRGTIDFGSLGLAGDTAIVAFKIRETHDHFSVDSLGTGSPIPEPGTLSLLAIGGVGMLRRKFR